ncbi:MAG: methyltransferase domain-containing protein [Pyrinomonadaceae bacterium]
MDNQQAYNAWSATYDAVENKTRDLEKRALRESVSSDDTPEILEIGCGTGKNTEFLQTFAKRLTGADFSAEMLARAKAKINAPQVEFRQLDLRETWDFGEDSFDLIVCSLALEHIENIDFVFAEAHRVLRSGGRFYIGELHPFKQYRGSKARFEAATGGEFVLECFTHHVSEFFAAGKNNGFALKELEEWFDDDDKTQIPRLLTLVFENRK